MSEGVKLSVQLPHGDGLGVEHVCVGGDKCEARGRQLTSQGCLGRLQHLVALWGGERKCV